MQFQKVEPPARTRISDSIVQQIEQLIVDGTLKPGDGLPPERELAQALDVSRPSLREAIVKLEARGLLQPRRGGGMQVVDVFAPTLTDPLVQLLRQHPAASYDVLELRHALEQVAAGHAAARASDAERHKVRGQLELYERSIREGDPLKIAERDAEFHLAIADASHNVALSYVMRGLFNLLRSSIAGSLETLWRDPAARLRLSEQHAGIWQAIEAADPERARQEAHRHLAYVEERLRGCDADGNAIVDPIRRGAPAP